MPDPKYALTRTSDGQFMFSLHAANGEIVLTSRRYAVKADAQSGVDSVKENSPIDSRYDGRQSSDGQYYFVLNAANGEIIGTSQLYKAPSGMEHEIVKTVGPIAPTEDQT